MKIMNLSKRVRAWAPAMVLGTAVFITGCSDSDNNDTGPTQNILEIAVDNANTTTLEAAVLAANESIGALLSGDSDLTVFAPTDAAFAALLSDLGLTAEQLLDDTDLLNAVLPYHVLATETGAVGSTTALSVAASMPVTDRILATQATESVALSISEEDSENVLYVNTSRVVTTDVEATNGVIHLIDKVLLPPPSANSDTDSTIAEIVTALAGAEEAEFTTLLAALSTDAASALLTAASDETSTLTVFAPTDAAFATLLADEGLTAEQLLDSPNLATILQHHILGSVVSSIAAYASNGEDVTTLDTNTSVAVSIQDNALLIDDSTVTEADIQASNGVIHVIDAVIYNF